MIRGFWLATFLTVSLFALVPRAESSGGYRDPLRLARYPEQDDVSVWDDAERDQAPVTTQREYVRSRGTELFIQVDYWTVDGAYRKDKEATSDTVNWLVASRGYDSAVGELKTAPGLGLRAGGFFPTRIESLKIGGSIGYIWGPTAETQVLARSSLEGDGRFNSQDDTTFLRCLLEALKIYPINRHVDLKLRGGIGWLRGEIESKGTATGSFVSALGWNPSFSTSNSWSGFTWEFIPSFLFKGTLLNFEAGIGYAQFPGMDENNDYNRFKWNPVGIRLGVEFF